MPAGTNNYIYEDGTTDAERYLQGCLDGKYVVGERIKQLARMMLDQIKNGYMGFHYDPIAATRPVEWIETFCNLSSGTLGVPFILEPYERNMIELIFGFVDDKGYRRFQEAFVVIGRKNGKTELCAALNLYMLTSDEVNGVPEGAPQCYNIASTEAQAATCYGATVRMLSQSKRLQKYVKKKTIVERKTTGLYYAQNMGYLVTLSRNTDALDGLNAHYAVVDEVGAMRDRSGYDLIKGSLGSQAQPLVFSISTNGKIRDGLFDANRNYAIRWLEGAIEDPRFIGILYEMDDRAEVRDKEMWPKANPGLGTVKKWDYLSGEVTRGTNDPTYMPEVMTKHFNLPANQSTAFLTWEQATCRIGWEFNPKEFKYCVIGIDASDSIDLSAATALMMKPGDDHIYRKSMYWIPEEQLKVGKHANMQLQRDGVPYLEWSRNDYLRIIPESNTVPKTVFLDFIMEMAEMGIYCKVIGYDQWHMQEIEEKMRMMVGEANVVRVPQWPKNLSDPMKRLRADLDAGRIIWNSPVDDWCNLNVSAKIDANDNYFPEKKGRVSGNRIDGFMSLLDAYIVLTQRWDEFQAAVNG